MKKINILIMAGGSGSRLWPTSRSKRPKQFLEINSNKTMLQETILRISNIDFNEIYIVCNEEHRFFAEEQANQLDMNCKIILEPVSKNTCPAISASAFLMEKDSLMLILSADHVLQDDKEFLRGINKAVDIALDNKLVTFGISANKPHTGYGYIKKGRKLSNGYLVESFVEKPSYDLAKSFIESGEYLWNSGMFIFKTDHFLDQLHELCPEIYKNCKDAALSSEIDNSFIRLDESIFNKCESISIDNALLEKTTDAAVVPLNLIWSDIGSWKALSEISTKDEQGNSLLGDVIAENTNNSYLKTENILLATVGLDNHIVVATKDAVLVANKDKSEDIKNVVEKLKEKSREEVNLHREVFRPWGKYDSIDNGNNYQVKKITVNPGAKLSVQKHFHRSEHWVVVSGTAKVTKGNEKFILNKNESTYIAIEEVHALENPGDEELILIEVQSGNYLGEDDIVRFDDIYGRA